MKASITFRLKTEFTDRLNILLEEINKMSNVRITKTEMISFLIQNAVEEDKEKLLKKFIKFIKCIA